MKVQHLLKIKKGENMEITLQEIVFYVVAAAIAVFSVLAVTTGKNFTRRYLPAFRPFLVQELFTVYWDIPS